jgi:PEP-CTERM motif
MNIAFWHATCFGSPEAEDSDMVRIILAAAVCGALMAPGAGRATILYDNGPANDQFDAWTINEGFQVADTFVLGGNSTLTGATFDLWNFSGDQTTQVDWSILSNAAGNTLGTTLYSGTVSVSNVLKISPNDDGYDINADSIGFPEGVTLAGGTYWFELQNAVTTEGNPTYWDMNGGPSSVWESQSGYNPGDNFGPGPGQGCASDTFQILGRGTPGSASGTCGSGLVETPEPASLSLLGFSLIGLAGLARRKRV